MKVDFKKYSDGLVPAIVQDYLTQKVLMLGFMNEEALPLASMQEIHQYGRSLIALKKTKEALEVFQLNYKKNPNQFTTLMGLTRGHAANADYKNALKYASLALPLAPNDLNKKFVSDAIEKLKKGQDIN